MSSQLATSGEGGTCLPNLQRREKGAHVFPTCNVGRRGHMSSQLATLGEGGTCLPNLYHQEKDAIISQLMKDGLT